MVYSKGYFPFLMVHVQRLTYNNPLKILRHQLQGNVTFSSYTILRSSGTPIGWWYRGPGLMHFQIFLATLTPLEQHQALDEGEFPFG